LKDSVAQPWFDGTIPHTGTPPGFRVLWGNKLPWPMNTVRCVAFVPEETQGEFDTVIRASHTIGFLVSAPETDYDREQRNRLFETGKAPPLPGFMKWSFGKFADESQLESPQFETGTLSGHSFPLRYLLFNPPDPDATNEQPEPEPKDENTGKPRPGKSRAHKRHQNPTATVDLTPPNSKGTATTLWIIRMRENGDPITPEFLAQFCKNFRPGE
jgi:hypothetical protein